LSETRLADQERVLQLPLVKVPVGATLAAVFLLAAAGHAAAQACLGPIRARRATGLAGSHKR
jgi:hypothetical protein